MPITTNKLIKLTFGVCVLSLVWAEPLLADESDVPGTDIVLDVVGQALATDTHLFACRRGDEGRRVEIHYVVQGQPLPCEVTFYKDNGVLEQHETLWYAQYQVGFCEQQAQTLVDRLKGAGWQCED